MQATDSMMVARHLETMGVDIIRNGFASWIRDGLGFQASDEHVEKALVRVQDMVAGGHATSVQELAYQIAAAMPARGRGTHIDAFGGSAWMMD